MLEPLPNRLLLEAYQKSLELELEPDFLLVLKQEMDKRGLSDKNAERA
ncbi:sporulation histidine kinase inhibitor Sda [Shouchella shacheensis]|nr:sporulation histidine kinase inhibitor Sda [Shouchella shacheensis]